MVELSWDKLKLDVVIILSSGFVARTQIFIVSYSSIVIVIILYKYVFQIIYIMYRSN